MHRLSQPFPAALLISLTACGPSMSEDTLALYRQIPGVWVSDGYGYAVDLRSNDRKFFFLSGDKCFFNAEYTEALPLLFNAASISLEPEGDRLEFGTHYEPHRITLHRQSDLPEPCKQPLPDTVEGNFEAFAASFASHYAFFDTYNVDWPARVKTARARITPDMSDEELFHLFAEMIQPLQDGHLSLDAEIDGEEYSYSPKNTALFSGLARQAAELGVDEDEYFMQALASYQASVANDVLKGQGQTRAGGKVQYGVLEGNIGYLNVLMLTGWTGSHALDMPDTDDDEQFETVNSILDEIIADFNQAGVDAVIIDASVNFGGNDFIGRQIASRFADKRRLAYTKYAGDAEQPTTTSVYVGPVERPSFLGPVYLMTSPSTISAAEIMTMSLRALPNVTHIGQPTNGALSDVLGVILPNGWELSLSNEIYRDAKGILWEGRGISPTVPLTIVSETDLLDHHPDAVATVVERIKTDLAN